jgi:hypothetical protein
MKELVRTNDAVFLSWLRATLADAGIEAFVFDQFTSAIEGSIGALPRRVMVDDDDFERARYIMRTEGPESGS